MYAKLIILAENVTFDEDGRVSANRMALDVVKPSFPATIEKLDLLTLWTRGPDEGPNQSFEIHLQTPTGGTPPEQIPVQFGDAWESWQGLSLDGFVVEQPGPYVFRFTQDRQDRGVWVMRVHAAPEAVGEA